MRALHSVPRTRHALIIEPLRPERFFIRTFNATSLYILSVCEVCGSYQCPYCPYYSQAATSLLGFSVISLCLLMGLANIRPL